MEDRYTMKPLRHFFSRALGACKPGKGKAGSSLALVMMVGAALVIWVMCIMPLMATTGATAAKTEQSYDDYLDSRSSIEYCKSELQDIVTREMPYTFAVIREIDPTSGDINYHAIKKMYGPATDPVYQGYVKNTLDPLDDTKDEPQDNEEGDKVAAICAVGPESGGVYPITITTFHNGEKGQSYSLSFTVSGSLLIFPESYKQNDALPLSDFAVVDGKMGANQVWDSTINMGNAVVSGGTGGFEETLLPWKLEPEDGYADTKEYPAAFKKTANAAPADASAIGEPLTDGEFTNENWIVPTAPESGTGSKPGEIWWDCKDNTNIKIHLYKDDNHPDEDITNSCTIYLNGVENTNKTVPAQEGYYCITVDYNGTGAYNADAVNVLPASGLRMSDVINAVGVERQTKPEAHNFKVERVSGPDIYTFSVTLTPTRESDNTGILYACCNGTETPVDGKIPLTWSESPTFTGLDATKTWYFYACRPAEIKAVDADGVTVTRFYEDSEPTCLGAVCPAEYATSLESGTAYAIVGGSEGSYSAMDGNLNAVSISDSYMVVPSGDSISIPTWTAEGSENQWALKNGNEKNGYKYLNLSGKCNDRGKKWKFSLGTIDSPTSLTVDFNEKEAAVWANITYNYPIVGDWITYPFYADSCLAFNGSFTASGYDKSAPYASTVKFLKVPDVGSAPSVTSPSDYRLVDDEMKDGFVLDYKAPSVAYVGKHISPEATLETLYANGQAVTKLDPGVYYLTAKLNVGTKENPIYRYADLGMLTIQKSTDNSAPDLTINQSAEDDLTVTITTNAPAYDSKDKNYRNMLLFGYKVDGEENFHWYPANNDNKQNRTFRLKPGKYQFAVCRFGDSTYEAVTTSEGYEITFKPVVLTEDNKVEFLYTFDKDSGTVWYKLPERILPCRVQLVFGSPIGDTGISWSETYTEGTTKFYGVIVESSNYDKLGAVLQVPPPVGITKLNGHTTSMMRGSSLYFMGQGSSINTYGNSVYLTADLVVLNKGIGLDDQGRGHVYVTPYSSGEGTPGDVLLFTVNDITCNNGVTFNARTFYRVPKDTDLCNPDASKIKPLGDVQTKDVKDLFRLGVYPEINLDIAYASDEQLAHVVSSETIRWTHDGVLSGQDNDKTNAGFVVCAYVSNINGSVSYKANRVLIATGDDSSHTLSVPANLTFTTRYLSIDADQVMGNGASFTIKNLGQDRSFIQSISNALGLTGYSSKTLQVDFERNTKIVSGDTTSVERQICRYEDGANLFSATTLPLTAPYTTREIKDLFSGGASWLASTVKTVDRYITLSCEDGSGSLNVGSLTTCELDIYANYIYVAPSVRKINVSGYLDNDLRISSQESGYTTNEYLGLFKDNSAESYSGTLVYFEGDVNFTYREGWQSKTARIEKGFYYVYAKDEGTSLKDLATNLFEGDNLNDNVDKKPYRIDPSSLKNYSVYIDSEGNISNAYVDTGIWDNTNTGLGGFSGGNVG